MRKTVPSSGHRGSLVFGKPSAALLAGVTLVIAVIASSPPRDRHTPRLQQKLTTIPLRVAGIPVQAELADSDDERRSGLMGRSNLEESEGMLFVFWPPSELEFWMKDTILPLSVAYMSEGGVIEEIYELNPLDETRVKSKSRKLAFALEMRGGWFDRHGVAVGAVVEGLPPRAE